MFELRKCQKEAVEAGMDFLLGKSDAPSLLVESTGFGKSLVIGELSRRLKSPLLVLQPSRELLLQNYEKCRMLGGSPTIYSASCDTKELSEMTYATLASIKNMAADFRRLGVKHIIVDEADLNLPPTEGSMWMKFQEELGDCKVLGLTASPVRLMTYQPMNRLPYSQLNMLTRMKEKFFKKIIHVTQNQEMVENGWWSNLRYESWQFDETGLVVNKQGTEYTDQSIIDSVHRNGINNSIYIRLMSLIKERKHILIFMDTVNSCEVLSRFLMEKKGIKSVVVKAGMKAADRVKGVDDFKSGRAQIALCYSTLQTGFDFPELDCLIYGRPTFSLRAWYQGLGRLVRIHPMKKNGLIIDTCNNFSRFGKIEDLTVEDYPGYGWGMFSGDRLLTGIPMGENVSKAELDNMRKAKDIKREALKTNRASVKASAKSNVAVDYSEHIMWMGAHKGKKFKHIPKSYFDFMITILRESEVNKPIFEYQKLL